MTKIVQTMSSLKLHIQYIDIIALDMVVVSDFGKSSKNVYLYIILNYIHALCINNS